MYCISLLANTDVAFTAFYLLVFQLMFSINLNWSELKAKWLLLISLLSNKMLLCNRCVVCIYSSLFRFFLSKLCTIISLLHWREFCLFTERCRHQMKSLGPEWVSCLITNQRFHHGTQMCCHTVSKTWMKPAWIFYRLELLCCDIAVN